ncbi:hypothetical protein MACK_003198 [Theileria orientalis]|uniref:Translation initiation factor eIF2B subunit epsilon n=1 Tax=Theileria orientalis TaxID=68886 RepID=A0A976SI94_THEOR|nr:hypothetical protein MACK_003198 [Theileria orientalis]
MEAVVLHQSDQFCMEPLNSYVDIFDLYIGNTSIWTETLGNLWYSGVNKVYLLVESYKLNKYNHLSTDNKPGGKEPKIKVEVVGLNVKMEVGTALREFFRLHGPMEPFILLFSNTLLTVPLTEAIEFHSELAKSNSSYCMTVLYVEDEKKRFSGLKNNSVILYDEKNELLYSSDENIMEFESEFFKSVKSEQINIRYDLYQPGVYLCTNLIIETFLELFDQSSMDQLIVEMLTQEIKTSEMYMYILKNDLSFPDYPAILRVETPRDYYNAYMEYVKRFTSTGATGASTTNTASSSVRKPTEKDYYGPMLTKNSLFINNSSFSNMPLPNEGLGNSLGDIPVTNVNELFKGLNSNITGSLVGSGVRIGKNSNIINSIVFNNVVIGSNCKVNNTIIMNNVTIEDNVTLEPGSLIGPCCRVNKDLIHKVSGSSSTATTSSETIPVRCATMKTKFYDLTVERQEDDSGIDDEPGSKEDGASTTGSDVIHVWEVESFINNPLNKIGSEYYDYVTFTMPDSVESTSDYEYDSEYEYGSGDSRYGSGTGSEYRDSDNEEEYESGDEMYEEESERVSEEFKGELVEMVHEALEDPKNLENKLLEIRSLRVAHNVTEHDTLYYMYMYGIEWVIRRFNEEKRDSRKHGKPDELSSSDVRPSEEEEIVEEEIQELIKIVESSLMNKLLESFSSKLAVEAYYNNTLNMCNKYSKSQLFFCQLCEALYHTDILEFEGFEKWLEENGLKEDRLVSFAKWVES